MEEKGEQQQAWLRITKSNRSTEENLENKLKSQTEGGISVATLL